MINKIVNKIEFASLEGMCFKLREIEHIKNNTKEWKLSLQFIESHMIIVAASGQGWLTLDGRFVELRQGGVYFCSPGQLIEAAVHSFDERGFYHIRFDAIEDDESSVRHMQLVKQDSRFPVTGEVILSSPVSISILCETICRNVEDENPLQRFRSQIDFQEMLYTVMQDARLVHENDSEEVLGYAKAYIEQHYQEDLTIEQLAKVAGISPRHFMRLFKKRYGYSAIDYLAVYRIERAQQLMRTGGHYRLRDIARHVGYHDDMYFRRKFKQISGIPPAAFIKNSRQKIVAYHSSNIGQLLALQVTPCAAPADHPWTDYYQRKYKTDFVLPLSSDEEIKREELQLAAPDFIIGIDLFVSAEEKENLGKIAPAFFVPWMECDWRKHLSAIARFLGRTAVAEAWLDHYKRKARFVSEQIKYAIKDDSLLILRISEGRINILDSKSIGTVFYDDLQVVPARGVNDMSAEKRISPAQLTEFDADRLLLIVDEDAQSKSSWKSLADSKLWNNLKAVRNGMVAFLPSYPWVDYTAFTNELLLDEALKLWRNRT